jgi:hypothetical protein
MLQGGIFLGLVMLVLAMVEEEVMFTDKTDWK